MSVTEPGAHLCDRIPLCGIAVVCSAFVHRYRGSNLGPHGHVASPLPSEPSHVASPLPDLFFLKVVNGSLFLFLFCDFHRTVEIGARSIFLWKIRPCYCSNSFQLSILPITVPGGLIGSCLTQCHPHNFTPSSSIHVCLHQLPFPLGQLPLSWIPQKAPTPNSSCSAQSLPSFFVLTGTEGCPGQVTVP